jgi:hypothetical protein
MRLTRTTLAIAVATAVVAALAACSPTVDTSATAPVPTAPDGSVSTGPDQDGAGIAPPAAPDAAALPDSIDPDSDAALVWQALMSPVGEYAAAASYLAVLDRFGTVEPYATILDGELRHIDALSRQLERLGIDVPDNPYLGVVVAPDSLLAAAEAWAAGEIENVALYDELLAQADDSRLARVLSNLRRASLESHLPLFEAAAAAGGTLDELPGHTP